MGKYADMPENTRHLLYNPHQGYFHTSRREIVSESELYVGAADKLTLHWFAHAFYHGVFKVEATKPKNISEELRNKFKTFKNIFESNTYRQIRVLFKEVDGVYVIQDSSGYFTIGYTKDLGTRVKAYATHNPGMKLCCVWVGAPIELEGLILEVCESKKIGSTDWFSLSNADYRHISGMSFDLWPKIKLTKDIAPCKFSGEIVDVSNISTDRIYEIYNAKTFTVYESESEPSGDAKAAKFIMDVLTGVESKSLPLAKIVKMLLDKSYCSSKSSTYRHIYRLSECADWPIYVEVDKGSKRKIICLAETKLKILAETKLKI